MAALLIGDPADKFDSMKRHRECGGSSPWHPPWQMEYVDA